jgi:hypothetical protein
MTNYAIAILDDARQDIIDLTNTIRFEYKAPATSVKYIRGLYLAINGLRINGGKYALQTQPFFSKYGSNVRRLNYKKMSIIYSLYGQTIYILRVIPSSIIKTNVIPL